MSASLEPVPFAPRCLSLDLEVGRRDGRIHKLAALRGDNGAVWQFAGGKLNAALDELDAFADGVTFLLGHNLTAFDRPHLQAVHPTLRLLGLPDVDTLRLNPLAFPRNPYHHLVKHYQDAGLSRGQLNDPRLDAALTLELFADQRDAFVACHARHPELLRAWHWLTTKTPEERGYDAFFSTIRRRPRPQRSEAADAIRELLAGAGCAHQAERIVASLDEQGWPLAYLLAWLTVAGGNSVMPPWVRHQFPETGELVRRLRDTPCDDDACTWCREHHDAVRALTRWFGYPGYRPEPQDERGKPLQQCIVEAAMRGEHVLGILPTGTGKSVCYQVPALCRYHNTGALTVVISPLVALMADQVAGMEARGLTQCAAVNGLLSWPERMDVLDRVRLGDVAILIISPEQLRNRTVRRVLAQREIGGWVLDEAHCLSKWGHDFRPDYRYVGRFIRERAGDGPVPPVLCLTATAKVDVVADIRGHFRDKLGIDLALYDGGANRSNLQFAVVGTNQAEKLAHVHQVLEHDLPADVPGGAIVYCASRRRAEEIAAYLREKGLAADHFHAGLPPETRKDVQRRFIDGELRVIAATNAFGMGIDKPDVRLVIHADMPGSLENYLQEAGRAGRDQQAARCVLLYTPEDIEFQFGLSARSRLSRREIAAILKAVRRLDRKKRFQGEVVATPGEILLEEEDGAFERETATDDTRVRTAVAWLEEAQLLAREENRVQMFPSSLRISSVEEAQAKLESRELAAEYRQALLKLVGALIDADPDEGISTDELMGISGLTADEVRKALFDLETLGIASNDTVITAFVHEGVERSSKKRLAETIALETDLIELLQEAAPDLDKGDSAPLHLRVLTQHLKDKGHPNALPEMVWRLVRSLAGDGRDEAGGVGSIDVKRLDVETSLVKLNRSWKNLATTAERRRAAASRLLDHLLECLPDARGTDLLAETTLGKLRAALEADLLLRSTSRDITKLLDRALLWLHEQEVIRLNKGLAVFRPAMTLRLAKGRRGFNKADFAPLQLHYQEQVVQIHVMAEFVKRGMAAMADALQLAMDYFGMEREKFLSRWMPQRDQELKRQTTPESWHSIVESLGNPIQQRIVADDREQTNVLVLAGPGSGKTRVLVHRIAYLLRVRRERPSGILALAYNRHAAVEIRRRLNDLVGPDARGVTVMTCHALAMRLTGASFADQLCGSGLRPRSLDRAFKDVLLQATALLKGEGLPPEDADEQRARLLAGFRWILVDEYQDVDREQYELISALAGRTFIDEDGRLTLFAVGDDDQNIYGFAGASVEFIRRFESDYDARPVYLVENYRSTANIIAAANALIEPAAARMKADHPIRIDRRRDDAPAGGLRERLDPVGEGRVQVLPAGGDPQTQAMAVMMELERLASLSLDWDWAKTAVIAREWKYLEPVRAYCELKGIPVQMAYDQPPHFWRLRETQALLRWLDADGQTLVRPGAIQAWLEEQPANPWFDLLREAGEAYALEVSGAELPRAHFKEWLAEWGREARRRQRGLLLVTAHRAKGLEFDHVAVLDSGWSPRPLRGSDLQIANASSEDPDTERRLYYVAMTRARQTLTLARMNGRHPLLDELGPVPAVLERRPQPLSVPPVELSRRYVQLTLRDVDLSFAGRYPASHRVHSAIVRLQPGDPLSLRASERGIDIVSGDVSVGRLAKAYRAPQGLQCIEASVGAVVRRFASDQSVEFVDRVAVDAWEVVVPELVYG